MDREQSPRRVTTVAAGLAGLGLASVITVAAAVAHASSGGGSSSTAGGATTSGGS